MCGMRWLIVTMMILGIAGCVSGPVTKADYDLIYTSCVDKCMGKPNCFHFCGCAADEGKTIPRQTLAQMDREMARGNLGQTSRDIIEAVDRRCRAEFPL